MAEARRGFLRFVPGIVLTVTSAFGAEPVLNVAHRGGIAPGYPENTLAAFRRAIAVGADVIELDLRATKDGAIVILHDETLDRTTSGSGRVTEHTLAEVQRLGVPTYREVLNFCANTGTKLLLDIKVSPQLDKNEVVRMTHEYEVDVIAGVRNLEDLAEFHTLDPGMPTLAFVPSVDAIEKFVEAGADMVRLWARWIATDPGLVARVQKMGKPVWVTANGAPAGKLRKLIAAGVDAILTDHPETLAELINK